MRGHAWFEPCRQRLERVTCERDSKLLTSWCQTQTMPLELPSRCGGFEWADSWMGESRPLALLNKQSSHIKRQWAWTLMMKSDISLKWNTAGQGDNKESCYDVDEFLWTYSSRKHVILKGWLQTLSCFKKGQKKLGLNVTFIILIIFNITVFTAIVLHLFKVLLGPRRKTRGKKGM